MNDQTETEPTQVPQRRNSHTHTVETWNADVPIGTPVRYFPVRGWFGHVDTWTRSEAWELGDGSPVVKITTTSLSYGHRRDVRGPARASYACARRWRGRAR